MAFGRARATWSVACLVAVAVAPACGTSPQDAATADPVLSLLAVAWSEPPSDAVRVEQAVAECMADAGFTYVPTTSGDDPTSTGAPLAPPEAATASSASSTSSAPGYGITSGPHPPPPTADPNATLVAALPAAEQQAYWTALEGSPSEPEVDPPARAGGDPDAGAWEYDWRSAGCRGVAQHEVYGDPDGLDEAAALQAELAEARLAAASDPRVRELDAAWSTCMAGAGHAGLLTADDAEATVRAAWAALWALAWSGLPADPTPSDVAAAEDAAQEAVDALAAQEADVAAADRDCRDEVGYDAARDAVTAEYQQRFYVAHRTALEAWFVDSGAVGE